MGVPVEYGGWRFPAGEAHLPGWMKRVQDWREDKPNNDRRLLYQGRKYRHALQFCKNRRTALDVGGHIGLWSWQMCQDFSRVWAFEPMPAHRVCFEYNLRHFHNFTLFPFALGDKFAPVHIRTRTANSSGDTGVDLTGQGHAVEMRTLDSFKLNDIDFVKIDCEGFELFVLRGGEELIKRCRPVVIIEQKPETGMAKNYGIEPKAGRDLLASWGMKEVANLADDHIMIWNA